MNTDKSASQFIPAGDNRVKHGNHLKTAIGSALGATFGFVLLRALLTPLRIRVVTGLLDPGAYGALTLLSMTVHGLAIIASLGGFETLLRKLPSAEPPERFRIFGVVFAVSSICGVVAAIAIGLFWVRLDVISEMATHISTAAAICLFLLFLHIQQRIYWLLGCRAYWPSRLLQLMWSDLWFVPLLVVMFFFAVTAETASWVWVCWLLVVSLLSWRFVPVGRGIKALVDTPWSGALVLSGLPLLPVVLGEWVFRLSGHYVLLAYTSATDMAFYALSLNIALIGLIAATPMVDMLCVELSHVFAGDEHGHDEKPSPAVRRILSDGLRHLFAVLAPAVLVMIFMPADIVGFFAAEDFLPAAVFLPYAAIMPVLLTFNLLFARILMLCSRQKSIVCGSLAGAVGAVILCMLFVPAYGVNGALLGIATACFSVDLLYAVQLRLWRWIDWSLAGCLKILSTFAVLAAGVYVVSVMPMAGIWRLLAAAVFCAITVVWTGLLHWRDFHNPSEKSVES